MFFRLLVNMSSKHTESDGCGKANTTKQILVASSVVGLVAATAAVACGHHRRKIKMKNNQNTVIPRLERRESGRVGHIESFSHYVARQVGFGDGNNVCPQLCKLAYEYLRKEKGYEEDMYNYFTNEKDIALPDSLYVKLVDEFERCILSYFAFHWTHASLIITQVLEEEIVKKTKLKHLVLSATRKQRFERVTKDLRVKRVFWTLVEEMKAIGSITSKKESECTDVMVPVAHSQRSPVFLLIGGGMGAGKSTVLKDILKESFWSEASRNAVVVEADAFKESDVVYRALSSRGHHHDMLPTAELVHQSSTDAASSLLVTALNEGRDVIMDGTLSWEPFFQQTMAMARNVHKCRYRMGIGYKMAEDGTITENYWEQLNEEEEELEDEKKHNIGETSKRKPYKIELVGVVCDPYLAVVRGIRRAIMIGRAVRVKSQLKSHKRFASAFPIYCELVDNARLYCTNAVNGTPKLIARKDGDNKLLVEPEEYQWLEIVSTLNPDADSIYELYADSNLIHQASTWNDIVLSSSRPTLQNELRASIRKIETHNTV